jgi:hypothetical protein
VGISSASNYETLEAKTEQLKPISLGIINFGSPFWGFSDALCYNLIRGAWTDAPGRRAQLGTGWDVIPYGFLSIPPENGYMGWNWLTQATLSTVRKDRKIEGFPQTHENKLGT